MHCVHALGCHDNTEQQIILCGQVKGNKDSGEHMKGKRELITISTTHADSSL